MTTHTVKRHAAFRILPTLLRDLLFAGLVLIVFALFHHALPRPKSAILNIVSLAEPAPQTVTVDSALVEPVPTQAVAEAPVVTAAPGDFSASFPTEDTGVGALYSYQGDALKIAIRMVQANDVTYYVADVYVKNISAFKTAFAKQQFGSGIHQEPLQMASANNAILALTGDYCNARNQGVVIRNGDLYRDSVNSDVCVLYADGVMETYREADFRVQDAIDRGAWQAWSFGPALMENGQAITVFDSSIQRKNPRNAIGYYAPGHYCFLTVDGRQDGYSIGMTLKELSAVFADLGCQSAFNLDGGATAEMIFQGQLVNKPYHGGRQSGDIIYF